MIVIVTIATVTHMPPTCVEHHQNLPLPPLHSLLFVFIVAVQTIGQWSAVTIPEIIEEEGHAPSPASNQYNQETRQKSAIASSKISKKSNGKSRNNDKPRTSGENLQRPATGRQHHQQPQCPTQGKPNNNSFPYRD